MVKKLLVGLALMVASATFAATIDTNGLTEAQVAELKAMAANAQAAAARGAAEPVKNTAKDVEKTLSIAATWGQQAATAAEGFAKAINIAAKELGITVNEFLKTDAGKLTAMLIIWKVMGASIVKLLVGMAFMTMIVVVCRFLYNKTFKTGQFEKSTYSYFGGVIHGEKLKPITRSFKEVDKEDLWGPVITMFVFLIVGTIITLFIVL